MKSTVSKLYDRHCVTVPKEMGKWRIDGREVEQQLILLSHTHGTETNVDKVQAGDSVRLSCEEGNLQGRVVLIYPGLDLPGAADAEGAVLGCCVNDSVTTKINGTSVVLKVEEILRRIPVDIDDALVQKEHLEGIHTVDEYRRMCRKRIEEQNRTQAKKIISNFILNEITKHSEYAMDSKEMEAWKDENARAQYEALIEEGEDPRIAEDGTKLTEEEAIENLKEEQEYSFKRDLVCHALCAAQGISLEWEALKEEFEKMIPPEMAAVISEEEMEEEKASYVKNAAITKVYDFLYEEAGAYLEE